MPRKPRQEDEGALHHVYARGNGRRRTFRDDCDRTTYLAILARVVGNQGWRCLAYCLMDNHVHLLIETPRPNLGIGMQRLHGTYAQLFNGRHGESGHLFQGRYGSTRIDRDEQLWATVSYIVRNPVEAGLCERPERWPWSSHAAVTDASPAPPWLDVARLLWFFVRLGGDPRQSYVELVSSAARR